MPAKGWRKDEQESNFDTVLLNENLSIDSFLFPKSTINKLSKQSLTEIDANGDGKPVNYLVAKDSQTVIQRSSVLFINFIYHHAKQLVKLQNRKVVNAEDILNALTQVGFSDFLPKLNDDLQKFNDKKEAKKLAKSKLKAESRSNQISINSIINSNEDPVDIDAEEDNTEVQNKRIRLDGSSTDASVRIAEGAEEEMGTEEEEEDDEDDNEEEDEEEEDDNREEGEEDEEADILHETDVPSHAPSQIELEQKELEGENHDENMIHEIESDDESNN